MSRLMFSILPAWLVSLTSPHTWRMDGVAQSVVTGSIRLFRLLLSPSCRFRCIWNSIRIHENNIKVWQRYNSWLSLTFFSFSCFLSLGSSHPTCSTRERRVENLTLFLQLMGWQVQSTAFGEKSRKKGAEIWGEKRPLVYTSTPSSLDKTFI